LNEPDGTTPRSITVRRAWLLVGFMWVAYFLNYTDRQVIFSIFPILKSELKFTDTELGLTGSIFLWVYALCSPIAGQIGDRFSKRFLVVLSLIMWSGITFLTGWSSSARMLLVCRALIGVTESMFVPVAMALTASAHAPGTRSRAVAILATAQLGGVVMGGWYGGLIAESFHWRMAFYSLGVIGICYAFPYFRFLKGISEGMQPKTGPAGKGLAVFALARIPSFRFMCLAFPAFTFALWLLYTWLPNFLYEKFSLSLADAGLTATLYLQGATLIGMLCGGTLADWFYGKTKAARTWLVCAGMFLCAPCIHLIGSTSSLFLTNLAATGFGFFSGFCMSNFIVSSFEVVPVHAQASAVGVLNLIGGFIAGFAALLGGVWKQTLGIHNLMSCGALVTLLGGLCLVYSIRRHFQQDYIRVH
jgi:predicted MFS family arabinose efflux permease